MPPSIARRTGGSPASFSTSPTDTRCVARAFQDRCLVVQTGFAMLELVVPIGRDGRVWERQPRSENAVSVLFSFSASEKRRHFSNESNEACGKVHNAQTESFFLGQNCNAPFSRGVQPHVATGSAVAHSLDCVLGGIESLISVQILAPVGLNVGPLHEFIGIASDRLSVFCRLSHAIKDVVAEWINPGDHEIIERLFVFADGSSMLSKGWPAEPARAG